ncbi:MAG: sigma-70 family RNA polymerase sigma factor [Acidobacteria bacterium]|nr:sigma-70 family RNA polymerase sigma factor [Acidobacteriota bacterium]
MKSVDVPGLLTQIRAGHRAAFESLTESVYGELRMLAAAHLRRRPQAVLQPTELVNEAFLKLVRVEKPTWEDRSHFFAVAATAMRQILVDEARRRLSAKRGGGAQDLDLVETERLCMDRDEDVLALNEALEALEATQPTRAELVELRFFGGMSMPEVAQHCGKPLRSLEREWTVTRAWLRRHLSSAT